MTYKKYIKRGGKVYGPYIYHSKRVDGKVVSEYHGVDSKKIDYKKFAWIGLGVVILMILIFGIYSLGKTISGKATYDLSIDYKEGEAIDGILKFSLKEGELLPDSSKVVLENNGEQYEYLLSDIISEEKVEGEFYLEGKTISGSGEGYGISGLQEIHPIVYFDLEIYLKEETQKDKTEQNDSSEEIIETSETEEPVEESEQETTEEPIQETIEEDEEEFDEGIGITGQAVSFIFGWMSSGNVVMELDKEINGEVSVDNPFTYSLKEGEEAEIKSKSVRTDSKELKDSDVKLDIEENKVIVTTDYSEKSEGFGENYLGEDTTSIELDLSDLNLVLNPGNLKISLVYSDEELVSLTTTLEDEKKIKEKGEELIDENAEEIVEEIPEEIIFESKIQLTDEEKAILINEFGTVKIETIREEIKGNRLIIGSQIREYKIEHTYEYPQSTEELKVQIQEDRTRWLKDIAATLLRKETPSQQVDIIEDDYVLE